MMRMILEIVMVLAVVLGMFMLTKVTAQNNSAEEPSREDQTDDNDKV